MLVFHMHKSSYKKALPPYILLIILPCIFGLFLYYLILNIDKKHEIEAIKSNLSERAVDFIAKTTAVDYFYPYFNKLFDELLPFIENRAKKNGSFMTNQEVTKRINYLSQKLGENIRCAIFDKNFNLLNPQDLLPHEQRFFTFAWQDIHELEPELYENYRNERDSIIGREFNVELMYGQPEICISTFNFGRTGVFFFKNASQETNGLIIFVEYKRTNIELIQAKIKDFATEYQPIILYDIEKKQRITSTNSHKEIPYERTNTDEFLDGFVEDNVVWKGFDSGEYKLLLGQTFDYSYSYTNKLIIAVIIFILILFFSSKFYFKNFYNKQSIYISIRYKLIFIFAIAVYIPTMSLWVLSYTSLHDHRIAIENKVKKGMLDILNKVDIDYKTKEEEVNSCYLKLDNYLRNLKGKELPSQEEFGRIVKEFTGDGNIRRNWVFNWLDIRGVDKTQIYTTSTDDTNSRIQAIARVLSVLSLEKYCPERLTYAGVKPSQSDIMVGNLLENPAVGFSSIIERPRQLTSQDLDNTGIYWWWSYYPDKDNPVAFFIGNATTRNTNLSYFNSLLKKRYSIGNVEIKLINYHAETQRFIPDVPNRTEFTDLINVSNINKTVESSIINYNNSKYLALCLPGSKLKYAFLIGLYPILEIDYQIEKVRSTIYILMILLLITSILTGSLLAKTFITPVNELNRGLEALRKRETETVIEIENNDELGKLGRAFNQMMGEIKDMLMAGAVQKCLIPTGKQNIDGYDCIIYNKMAADVGGDYADLFELPDNKMLIVIGDVNGHGVSSSLLSAMVKASVFLFANQNLPINEIVTNTSYMICDLLGNKKIMKLCVITLDKNTGELSICNAGHPYPLIREKELGQIRIPTNINLPIGISKARSNYTYENVVLNPEETLLLYTDGFIDANSNKTDGFGFDNLKNCFSNIITDNLEEIEKQLINLYKTNLGEKELADDISFIVLRRQPLQNN
ncbi:MAG: SpoIIE family protein phosphatase [Candidatus Riflebacteria bacterium]|nr:SpoIIE family protein phosphatase [Candidatus Riflebacteria bacterium]